jgi:salicylate hydroxylase
MALEDAVILAACLDSRETGAALRRYQQLRRDRCVRIVAAATRNARNFHLSPPMAGFAHLGLRAWSLVDAHGPFRRYRWIHDYDAPGVGATEYPSKTV